MKTKFNRYAAMLKMHGLALDAGFEESKHPRASNGQFGSGGGSRKSTPDWKKHKEQYASGGGPQKGKLNRPMKVTNRLHPSKMSHSEIARELKTVAPGSKRHKELQQHSAPVTGSSNKE